MTMPVRRAGLGSIPGPYLYQTQFLRDVEVLARQTATPRHHFLPSAMKRILPASPLRPTGILRPGFLACLLMLSPLLAAQGDSHWTSSRVRRDILTSPDREVSPTAMNDARERIGVHHRTS